MADHAVIDSLSLQSQLAANHTESICEWHTSSNTIQILFFYSSDLHYKMLVSSHLSQYLTSPSPKNHLQINNYPRPEQVHTKISHHDYQILPPPRNPRLSSRSQSVPQPQITISSRCLDISERHRPRCGEGNMLGLADFTLFSGRQG
jgi:hypothetical protein